MKGKLSLLLAAGCLFAILMSGAGYAQTDPRVAKSMETLKAKAEKLGAPKVEGKEAVGGKDAPALYFGTTKNQQQLRCRRCHRKRGRPGHDSDPLRQGWRRIHPRLDQRAETRRQRTSDWYCFGRTGARSPSRRAKHTTARVPILGTPYMTGYEPIRDASGATIGVYYVGYKNS